MQAYMSNTSRQIYRCNSNAQPDHKKELDAQPGAPMTAIRMEAQAVDEEAVLLTCMPCTAASVVSCLLAMVVSLSSKF